MARSAAGSTIFLMVSLHGISSISATFYRSGQKAGCNVWSRCTHLANESIQEDLAQCMAVSVPFKGVDFAEGMELLGAWWRLNTR